MEINDEKQCFKCHKTLSLDDFYKHSQMADGYLNKCKECTKKDVAARYIEYFDRVSEYERKRFKTSHRKAKILQYQKKRRRLHPDKYRARKAVARALRSGKLTKQPCRCGSIYVQAHHKDYSKPLDVEWLCFKCHRKDHGQLNHEYA